MMPRKFVTIRMCLQYGYQTRNEGCDTSDNRDCTREAVAGPDRGHIIWDAFHRAEVAYGHDEGREIV